MFLTIQDFKISGPNFVVVWCHLEKRNMMLIEARVHIRFRNHPVPFGDFQKKTPISRIVQNMEFITFYSPKDTGKKRIKMISFTQADVSSSAGIGATKEMPVRDRRENRKIVCQKMHGI
jgi:hypothetical protein